MKMKIRTYLALMVLGFGQAAFADFEIVTLVSAVELSPSNMIMPASTNGMMTFKPCAGDCDEDFERARLTAETVFSIAGKAVKFEDFATEFAVVKNIKSSYALVSVDKRTKTVTSIDIAR